MSDDPGDPRRGLRKKLEVFLACHSCAVCPRCGTQVSENPLKPDSLCDSCSRINSPLQNRLYNECRDILNKYISREINTGEKWKHVLLGDQVTRRYLYCNLVHRMCVIYTVALAYDVQQMVNAINAENPSCIWEVQELDFLTYPYWEMRHWIFVIRTSEGTFVFDPTGRQFGPDWGLFQPWDIYKNRRIYAQERSFPLGHVFSCLLPKFTFRDVGLAPSVLYERYMRKKEA